MAIEYYNDKKTFLKVVLHLVKQGHKLLYFDTKMFIFNDITILN